MKTKLAFASLSLFVFGFSIVFGQGEVTSGRERIREKAPFSVGTINTLWAGGNSKEDVCIWLWNNPASPLCCSTKYSPAFYKLNPEKLQYTFPEETELKDIKDPTAYEYKSEYWYPQYPMRIVNGERIPSKWIKSDAVIPVNTNQIVILKLGDKYAAIKPLTVERRYNSLEEMPPRMQADWKKMVWGKERWRYWPEGLPPYFGWMTYEWKYWNNPSSTGPKVASVETQLQRIGLTPQEIRRLRSE